MGIILLTILSLSAVSAANETDDNISLDDGSLVELSDNNFENEVKNVENNVNSAPNNKLQNKNGKGKTQQKYSRSFRR